ncbi:DUF6122 family protein [Changchengzhania lutea]|uniref:DUF6122 family protein n=1 Tax=Changchengzhania lutea TaxID=2049305 RepID=UPI00115DBA15|nr:DUF6122 family protein [Changchengzhania lutea]
MIQTLAHYSSHALLPLIVALVFYKSSWKLAFIIMLSGWLIDIDHVLADPMFDPNRCSINFHPLHKYYAIAVYVLLLLPKKTRLVGLGLIIHIFADTVDCSFM